MSLFNIRQRERIQTSLPSLVDSHGKSVSRPASKNPYVNAKLERSHANHTTYSWYWYGRFSKTQCHWRLFIRQNKLHFTLPTIRYLKASPGTAIIERDMLVDIPFIADWKKIGEHRQPTGRNTDPENESRVDYDNRVVTKYSYGTDWVWSWVGHFSTLEWLSKLS